MNLRSVLRRTAGPIAALLLACAAVGSSAQEPWPSRPITMVVAASAGSGTDLLARELAHRLAVEIKQSIVVDNKPGASGVIATQAVIRAAPDGYTLLYTNGTNMVMAPALLKSIPYDVTKDVVPVAQTAAGGVLLHVSNDMPVRNLQELIALVKANPGKYSYGSWAVGSSGHLTMEWLKRQTGMQITHVPYKQVNQLLTEIAAQTLKIGFSDPAAPLPFIETGRIRTIAATGLVRLPRTPDVPTFAEQGHVFEPVGWFGVFAPAHTPEAILQRLNAEIVRIQSQPDMVAKITAMNISVPPARKPAQFHDTVVQDLQMWKKIVTDAGITTDN